MKNIVIVVDMQNGVTIKSETKKLIGSIQSLLSKNIFDVVICTRFLNDKNSIYEKAFNWTQMINN